jgi:hypothetical protein
MGNDYDLFAVGNTHFADQSLIVVALLFEAVLLGAERLRAPSIAESIRNDETNTSVRPSFHLVSPPIASQAVISCFIGPCGPNKSTYAESGKP